MSILDSLNNVLRTQEARQNTGSLLGGMGLNGYGEQFRNYVAGEIPGTLDMAGFNAAKGYDLQRLGERNELAQKFGKESDVYNMQLMQQAQASETFMNRLGQIDTRLGDIKAGSYGSASKATSKRQYAQLSQQAMQGTARYLAELERFQAPKATDIDFTFADPITGKKLDIGTAFDDVYADGLAPGDAARSMVMTDFARIRDEKASEARSAIQDQYGAASDYYTPGEIFDHNNNRMVNTDEEYQQYITAYADQANRLGWRNKEAMSGLSSQFDEVMRLEGTVTDYSEAAALAQMGGFTDSFEGGTARHQYDPISLFYQQDVNAVLDDMVGKTTERLDIARLTERADVQKEFERRQQSAIQERDLFNSQLQRNQQQAERIEAEKQSTRMRMEQQKREYAESMSSFGASPVDGGTGITFNDTRPQ